MKRRKWKPEQKGFIVVEGLKAATGLTVLSRTSRVAHRV